MNKTNFYLVNGNYSQRFVFTVMVANYETYKINLFKQLTSTYHGTYQIQKCHV